MNDILTKLNDFMYTYVLIIMLVAVGVYFTIRTIMPQASDCSAEAICGM